MISLVKELELKNEYIHKVVLNSEFESKPLFSCLSNLEPNIAIQWVDRFSPLEAVHCEWVLAEIYSQIGSYIIPKRAEYLRCVLSEIQSIIFYLSYLSKIFFELKDEIRYEQAMIIREKWFDVLEVWSGGRVLPQALSLPGVNKDLTLGIQTKLKHNLEQASRQFLTYFSDLEYDKFYQKKLYGFACIPKKMIETNLFGGVIAKSIGVESSVKNWSDWIYYNITKKRSFNSIKAEQSDAWSRMLVALFEIKESMNSLKNLLQEVPQGNFNFPVEGLYLPADLHLSAVVEAPSGPLIASYINGKYSLSSSSSRMYPFVEELLSGVHYEDLKLALVSWGYDMGSICD